MKQKDRSRGLHGRVVHDLGRRIVAGEFVAGAPLPSQDECCELVGVSRSVLREALRVLAAKGMVEARPKAGTFVRPRSAWNFLDPEVLEWRLETSDDNELLGQLHELRQMVEPVTASLAAERAKLDDFIEMGKAFDDMVASDHDHSIVEPDLRFHRAIIAASGNEVFVALGRVIESALKIAFQIGRANPQGQDKSLAMHKAILDAIVDRNGPAARGAMEKLINYSNETLVAIRAENESTTGNKKSEPKAKRHLVA